MPPDMPKFFLIGDTIGNLQQQLRLVSAIVIDRKQFVNGEKS